MIKDSGSNTEQLASGHEELRVYGVQKTSYRHLKLCVQRCQSGVIHTKIIAEEASKDKTPEKEEEDKIPRGLRKEYKQLESRQEPMT